MDVGLLARLTVVLVLGAFLAWFGGLLVGLGSSSVPAAVVLRTLLSLLTLALLARALVRRAHDSPELSRTVVAAALLSYALFPPTWGGRALFGQLLVAPGVSTVAVDLVPWVAVLVLAVRTVTPRPARADHRPYEAR